jgi:hypothetical protein
MRKELRQETYKINFYRSIRDKLKDRTELLMSYRGEGPFKYDELILTDMEWLQYLENAYLNFYQMLYNISLMLA